MNTNFQGLRKQSRAAFTLVEMLIAMALTLILVYSIAEFYAYIGNAVRDGRATIEMGGQLRAATAQLNDDLQSLTLRPTPWIDPNSSPGYFTMYEGPGYDADPEAAGITAGAHSLVADNPAPGDGIPDLIQNNNITNLFGDGDDVLAFTIRAKDIPFQGRYNGTVTTSPFAEVIWFTTFVDADGDSVWDVGEFRFLCRRLLLILPNAPSLSGGANGVLSTPGSQANAVTRLKQIQQDHDISATIVTDSSGNYYVKANSLSDLSLRQNRFACRMSSNATATSNFPHGLDMNPNQMDVNPNSSSPPALRAYVLDGVMRGEDRVLTNVLAFDVRVFDPEVRIYRDADSVTALVPGDPGYRTAAAVGNQFQGQGAWVDLYFNQGLTREGGAAVSTHFSRVPNNFSYGIWDTWPLTYELQGPGNGRAFNGLDDDGANGVDDPGERQTQPPYAVPLRGIQVRIRIYEPHTRQMRQATVGADFVGD